MSKVEKKNVKRSIYGLTSFNFGCMRNGQYCYCKYLLSSVGDKNSQNILINDFGQHCAFVIPRSGDHKWALMLEIALRLSLMPRYFPGMGVQGFLLTSALGLSTELKVGSFQVNGIWHK